MAFNLVGLRVISLNSLDGVQEIWFDSQGIEGTLGNKMEVHLAKILRGERVHPEEQYGGSTF